MLEVHLRTKLDLLHFDVEDDVSDPTPGVGISYIWDLVLIYMIGVQAAVEDGVVFIFLLRGHLPQSAKLYHSRFST